jgi:glycosyltransferase involved in cell wall biosynthesis
MRDMEDLETILAALAQLPAQYHLVGLGPAPQPGYLLKLRYRAARLGVARRFHIAPLQPPHAVARYIADADIGVIARRGQRRNMRLSLPNRLFQMIAARLPVIVTPLAEIAKMVEEWSIGLVVAEGDAAGLAAAARHIDDPANHGRFCAAVERAAVSLSWEAVGAAYVRFIEDVARSGVAAAPRQTVAAQVPAGA